MKNLHTFEEFLNESYAYDIRRGLKHIKFRLSDPLMYKTPFYISFKKGTDEKEVEALIKETEKENKSVSKMKRTYGLNPYSHLTLQIENPNYGGLTWIFKALDKLYGNSGESMGWHGEIQESVNEATTLASMFAELGTWITFTPEEKEAAKKSKVTDSNNKRFKDLVKDWSKGMYDEDPQYAAQELRSILGPIKK